MNCFYDHDAPAVGICLACGRALCRSHAAEVADRLACVNRHEKEVAELRKSAGLMVSGTRYAIGLLLIAGLGLAAFGLWQGLRYGSFVSADYLTLVAGGVFALFGLFWFWSERRRL